MKAQNVKVTTTSSLDGVKIEEYIEPITAHVVVGMNVFKDFMSGFTDFFGGKSSSYQNTLRSINNEAINELRKKAFSIGANCVLGLKIDNDEISAQGKSMMMVTAIGTAVKADFLENSIELATEQKSNRISIEYFNLLNQKKQYILDSKEGRIKLDDRFWAFIAKNSVAELSDFVLSKYQNFIEKAQLNEKDAIKKYTNNVIDYLSSIDSDIAISSLYSMFQTELSEKVRRKLIAIVIDTKLVDYSKVLELINNSNFIIQKTGIEIAQLEKLNYETNDISLIESIITLIPEKFQERGEKTSKKKMLSSKEKEIWICECEKENDIENEYCSNCNKDIYGFVQYEGNPNRTKKELLNVVEILKTNLK